MANQVFKKETPIPNDYKVIDIFPFLSEPTTFREEIHYREIL